ncbi:hydroxypyruvate reductase [Tepiditoga spiralis]|uniref:Hydroxypyruvate reductase n=1 Tax=Tepiditoga spiralis TaxID=2108365 RepID=A0A7G1GAZ0_9BACT|nr:D-2-hydroxyacid dehydrogenase [Tepiditoga spiralis]BBE30749.1 hydroxypyruvate reductase [Tepiditoga spiralis]
MWLHINDPLAQDATDKLKELLPEIKITVEHYEPEVLKEKATEMDVLVVRSATKVTKDIIEAAPKLKIIGRAGMGLDNIDLETAKSKNIQVINTPGANSLSVAELVVGMILSLYRYTPRGTQGIKEGKWEKKQLKGLELTGKTLGIVGFGNIGKLLSKLVSGFGVKVLVFDVFDIPEEVLKEYNVEKVSLEEIYKNADIISLHVPKNDKTYHMISSKQFEAMKDGVVIINAARGGIVDEEALLKYLENGKVFGAGLDVYENEPPKGFLYEKLMNFNVVATPHIGATTKEAQWRVGMDLVDRLVKAIK